MSVCASPTGYSDSKEQVLLAGTSSILSGRYGGDGSGCQSRDDVPVSRDTSIRPARSFSPAAVSRRQENEAAVSVSGNGARPSGFGLRLTQQQMFALMECGRTC